MEKYQINNNSPQESSAGLAARGPAKLADCIIENRLIIIMKVIMAAPIFFMIILGLELFLNMAAVIPDASLIMTLVYALILILSFSMAVVAATYVAFVIVELIWLIKGRK